MWWIDEAETITKSKQQNRTQQNNYVHNFTFFLVYIFGVVGFILFTTGCSLLSRSNKSAAPAIFSLNPATFKSQDFETAQKNLIQISENHPDPTIRRKAVYHLAKTLAHYNNPSPQYNHALLYFKQYLQDGEETAYQEECRNWITVLHKIKDQSEKLTNLVTLHQNLIEQKSILETSKKENEKIILQLKQEITKLKNNIKRLDSLYLKMERKRRRKN